MYEFKTKPYEHQLDAFKKSYKSTYYGIFMEMGTGKSKVAIDTMGALYEAGEINTALIVAPKGVFDNWVQKEIPVHLPERIQTKIVRWQPNFTQKFRAEIRAIANPDEREPGFLHILVMNTEAFSTSKGAEAALRFVQLNPECITILDESTSIKNKSAQRTKNLIKVANASKYKRILTGSPITKSPMDLYAQCAFLSEDALGFKSFYGFQNRYAIIQRRTMGAHSFNEITGFQRLDELGEKLDKFSLRVLKKDCLDLPEKVYQRREIPLTKEQVKLYKQMSDLALAKLASGELATTQSVLTQIMRLQQICCGHLQPDEGPIQEIPNNRLQELLDITEEITGKAIIWATWTHDIHRIEKALKKRYGADCVASYYGETEQDDRQEIVNVFQDPSSPLRFFIGQPKTGGYGITLTEASTVIYFSNSYDLEIRLQSEDRAHRIGQKNSVTYIDLVSPGTIDDKILGALRDKNNLAGTVLREDVANWLN
jgi:SNF2 family DNA or RNA helicase